MGAPRIGVKSMKITRSGSTFTASWKVPGDLKNSKKANHADNLQVTWLLGIPGKDPKDYDATHGINDLNDATSINNYKTKGRTYTLSSFYPRKANGPRISYLTCKVRPTQGKVKGTRKSIVSATYPITAPKAPSLSAFSVDSSTGVVSVTVTAEADAAHADRYDTEWYFSAIDGRTGTELVGTRYGTSTSTSITLTVDASSYQALSYTQSIKCYVKARNRGLGGDSAWAERTYHLAFPAQATIRGVDVSGTEATDKVTVGVSTNSSAQHPVTTVKLQRLVDVAYSTADEVAQATGWEDAGATDNASCTALTTTVSGLVPSTAGNYTWLRVQSIGAIEATLVRYSAPVRLDALHTDAPTASGDIVIASATPGEDGTTARVTVAWEPSGTTDSSTGTQLTWADKAEAWDYAKELENVYDFTESDGSVTHDGTTYQQSRTLIIPDLEEGQPTYVRARRYLEGDTTTYGEWSDIASIIPSVAPASVVLECDSYVAAGSGARFEWTFSGGSPQTAWQLVTGGGEVMASGTDANGAAEVDAERLEELATQNVVSVAVSVSTGGAWVTSDYRTLTIVQPPTLSLTPVGTITAQPLTLAITTSAEQARAAVTITSDGIGGQTPLGQVPQPQGDTVWSGAFTPAVTGGAATLSLPSGIDLRDDGAYTVQVSVTDLSTGLVSETATSAATVAWAHQAPYPDGFVTVTPVNTFDADGNRTRAATIGLTPPTGYASTDCYDIYRLTADGAALIGQSWPLTATVTDEYAPFGDGLDLAYRIAVRTADGDEAWTDVPYALGGDVIRIDWPSGPVELPYDIAISDSYKKDYKVDGYLDGQRDAFHNQGVERTAGLSTNVIRIEDQETAARVRSLGEYPGTAFVRTPDGSAYEAVVEVTDLSTTGPVLSVSIDTIEVRLGADHMLPPWTEEE